jgi:uncharacterized protein YbjT (DUF2867 family)
MSTNIAVTAPTGNVGSRVVQLLVQAGVRPTLLLRDPDRLDPGLRPHVEVRIADLTDPDAVLAATAGADALFWLDTTPHFTEDPIADSAALGRTVASAVRTHGIGHTVFLSSVGAERRTGAGHIDGLAAIEQSLDDTGANVVHLRCGYFFTNLLLDLGSLRAGALATTMPPDRPMPWVDPRDVGEVAAARLLARDWTGRVVQAVHGPEDLTYDQVATILSAATGRAVTVAPATDDELRQGLLAAGMSAAAADGIVGMTAGTRDGFSPEQPRDALTTTPTTLAAWAHATLRPLLN